MRRAYLINQLLILLKCYRVQSYLGIALRSQIELIEMTRWASEGSPTALTAESLINKLTVMAELRLLGTNVR